VTAEAIESAAARLALVVAAISGDELDRPTPCEAMTVGDLLDHVHTFCGVFTGAAVKDLEAAASPGRPPSADRLATDWRESIPERLSRLSAAWLQPSAWEGQTQAGKLPASGELAGRIALDELVVHGWDLARATGQQYAVDEATLELVKSFIEEQVGDGKPIPREAVFNAAVPTAADAPLLDRVIGLSGRDPSWAAG